jgi:GxxExxY protein
MERVYEACLAAEFAYQGLEFVRQPTFPITYRDVLLEEGLRLDFIVASTVLVELKAVETVLPVHEAQVLSYLRLTGLPVGLLINFNVPVLREGVKRIINPERLRSSASLR